MSKLEDLIAISCPNGVEKKKIGELCSIITKQTGFDYSNTIKGALLQDPDDNSVPYIQTKFFSGKDFSYNTDYYVPAWIVAKYPKITLNEKCILFSIVGASIGNVGLFPGDRTCFLGGAICVAKPLPGVNTDFLYYCTESEIVQSQIKKKTKGVGQATITVEDIREFVVPWPPSNVQSEIVRLMDTFAKLTAEVIEALTTELNNRKKQYEFYLNNYFESQTENLIPLEKVGKLTRGKRFVHADSVEDGVPCIHYGELYTFYGTHANEVQSHIREELRDKMRYAHKGDVIIVGAGENNIDIGIGVAWEGNEDVAVHDACYTLSHHQNSRYISYYLRSHMYHEQIKKYVSTGKICSISADGIGRALIPIPSLKAQEAIVEALDKYENFSNSLYENISAEIEKRMIQYEYYRDKILVFKEETKNGNPLS